MGRWGDAGTSLPGDGVSPTAPRPAGASPHVALHACVFPCHTQDPLFPVWVSGNALHSLLSTCPVHCGLSGASPVFPAVCHRVHSNTKQLRSSQSPADDTSQRFSNMLNDHVCVCVCVCSLMPISLDPHGLQPTRLLCPQDSPGKNTEVGCPSLLQGIFLTQASNLQLVSAVLQGDSTTKAAWEAPDNPVCIKYLCLTP